MPKLKTKKAAAKRFKITGSGKIIRKKAFRSHILEWKSSKNKRKYRKQVVVGKTDIKRVRQMLAGA